MMGYAGRGFSGRGLGGCCDNLFGGAYGGFGGPLMLLFGALILLGIVLLVVWAVRASRHGGAHPYVPAAPAARPDEASEILRRRLANGEITPEEYDKILPLLK